MFPSLYIINSPLNTKICTFVEKSYTFAEA